MRNGIVLNSKFCIYSGVAYNVCGKCSNLRVDKQLEWRTPNTSQWCDRKTSICILEHIVLIPADIQIQISESDQNWKKVDHYISRSDFLKINLDMPKTNLGWQFEWGHNCQVCFAVFTEKSHHPWSNISWQNGIKQCVQYKKTSPRF